jgi:hypothetical protein
LESTEKLYNLHLRSFLFLDFTQRIMVIVYRLFGTTYRSRLQGSNSLLCLLYTQRLSLNVGTELPIFGGKISQGLKSRLHHGGRQSNAILR